jgi:hypothetical protein
VHRDVSPPNIFVTFDAQAKVIDFGIAKAVDSSLETRLGILKGRVPYMAPEQALGRSIDHRADIYSAGVMVWEAAARRRLWQGMTDVEILSRLLREGPPSLRSVSPDASEELQAICRRAMAAEPANRYASCADFLEDLEAHLAVRSDKMTMREVGAIVDGAFADERRTMNAVIEEALVRARKGKRPLSETRGVAPLLESAHEPTPTGSTPLALGPASTREPKAGSDPALSVTTTPAPDSLAIPFFRWRAAAAAFGIAVAALGGLLVVTALPAGNRASPTITHQASPRHETRDGPGAPAADLIGVEVQATPPSALITIDGVAVLGNPFVARYTRSSEVHTIVAYATGYASQRRRVAFSDDVTVHLELEPHPSGPGWTPPSRPSVAPTPLRAAPQASTPGFSSNHLAGTAGPAVRPRSQAPLQGSVDPGGERPPLHAIETSNPYGEP